MTVAQGSVEVDSFLWGWGQSSEKQIIVEEAQIITAQSQPGCSFTCAQGLVLYGQRTLKKGHI